jgi:hypothetical protein
MSFCWIENDTLCISSPNYEKDIYIKIEPNFVLKQNNIYTIIDEQGLIKAELLFALNEIFINRHSSGITCPRSEEVVTFFDNICA